MSANCSEDSCPDGYPPAPTCWRGLGYCCYTGSLRYSSGSAGVQCPDCDLEIGVNAECPDDVYRYLAGSGIFHFTYVSRIGLERLMRIPARVLDDAWGDVEQELIHCDGSDLASREDRAYLSWIHSRIERARSGNWPTPESAEDEINALRSTPLP